MLSSARAIALKTALYNDAVEHDYVVPGFRVYRRILRTVFPVAIVGKPCRAMIRKYQDRHKLPITGQFDTDTQALLLPPPPKSGGQKVADAATRLIALAPRHYSQARPAPMSEAAFELHGSDCSGVAILCYKLASLPDPNGTGYNGYGYTGSLIRRGKHVDFWQKEPGDLVFYGPHAGDSTHVTIYLGDGKVASHGHEGGPFNYDIDYRGDRIEIRRYA